MVGSLVAVRESSSTRHGEIEALHYGRIFKLHKRHKKGQAIWGYLTFPPKGMKNWGFFGPQVFSLEMKDILKSHPLGLWTMELFSELFFWNLNWILFLELYWFFWKLKRNWTFSGIWVWDWKNLSRIQMENWVGRAKFNWNLNWNGIEIEILIEFWANLNWTLSGEQIWIEIFSCRNW